MSTHSTTFPYSAQSTRPTRQDKGIKRLKIG